MAKIKREIIDKIRIAFVQGTKDEQGNRINPTVEQLSKEFKIPAITLYRKSKSENWKQQKISFNENLAFKVDQEKQKTMATQHKDFDSNNLRIAKAIQGEIISILAENNRQRQEGINSKLYPSSLNALSQALQTCQKVGKLALGEATEHTHVTTKQSTVTEAFALIDEVIRTRGKSEPQLH